VLSVTVLVLALAACGGGGALDSDDIFGSAADNTVEAETAQLAIDGEISSGTQRFTVAAEGSFDIAEDRGQITQTLTFPNGEAQVDQISDKGVTLIRAPILFGSALPEGVEWLRIAPDEQTSLRAAMALTPTDLFELMRLASTEVEEVGTEEVAGAELTHYRAEVDPEKLAADAYQTKIDAVHEPIEIWVDEDGIVRRVKVDFTALYDPGSDQRVRTVSTTDLSDFGSEVTVEMPPENAIVDSTDIAQG
jgi:hypothetical protein